MGWFPIGIYRSDDVRCLRVLTSRWKVNAIAIHPAGRIVAIGTGSYDGGYFHEGELLVLRRKDWTDVGGRSVDLAMESAVPVEVVAREDRVSVDGRVIQATLTCPLTVVRPRAGLFRAVRPPV